MKKNYDIIDFMKMVAAIFVVGIHTNPFYSYSLNLNTLFRILARLAVPLFFISSGFLIAKKVDLIDSFYEKRKYIIHYIKRIIILFISWYIVNLPFSIYFSVKNKEGMIYFVKRYIISVFITDSYNGGWYLTATVIGVIIVFLLILRDNTKVNYILLVIISILLFSLAILNSEFYNLKLTNNFVTEIYLFSKKHIQWALSPVVAPIYLSIGILAKKGESKIEKIDIKWLLLFDTVFGIIMFYEVHLIRLYKLQGADDQFMSLVPMSFFLFITVLKFKESNIPYSKNMREFSTICFFGQFIWLYLLNIYHQNIISRLILSNSLIKFSLNIVLSFILYILIESLLKRNKLLFLRKLF
ncbi:MAG: acyltransferase family protein [Lachnospiraceae bacterium]|nr:acyltransferase family protein [Lachnospiraceae bacterium]